MRPVERTLFTAGQMHAIFGNPNVLRSMWKSSAYPHQNLYAQTHIHDPGCLVVGV